MIKRGRSDFTSACSCEYGEAKFKPQPLYNKVKNNLGRLFFTKGSQTRNGKFNQTKFSVLKIRVSVRKI